MSDADTTDQSQKTEPPTPKKLEEARRRGQVAMSREVSNWMMLFAGTVVILTFAPTVMRGMALTLRTFLEQAHALPTTPGGIGAMVRAVLGELWVLLALPLAVLVLAAIAGPFLQIGPVFSTSTLEPKLEKISPVKGFSRLFSLRSMAEFVKGVLKLAIIGTVGFLLMFPFYKTVDHMVGLSMPMLVWEMNTLVLRLLGGVLAVLAVMAILDLMYQRYEHMKKLRMSRQEIRDEFRQTEGDPHVKARLRELRAKKAQQRMLQAVPEASVVITNPTHYAVALKYEEAEMAAPVLVAKGADAVAARIKETAEEHDIPIVENPTLARILYDTVELDDMIPPDHYKAVAEVISYVFRLKGRTIH